MTGPRPAGAGTAAVAALGLCASQPPAWFPGAELLVVAGLWALFRLATCAKHPYRWSYAVGLCHMFWFSWSLRHVTGAGLVAIGVLGAVYFIAIAAWARAFRGCGGAWLGFALGVAATHWMRANAPEVAYPHGQPAHALYGWAVWLGPVRWGGEALANGLLAAFAAGLAERRRVALASGALWAGLCLIAPPGAAAFAGPPTALRVAAVESRYPIRLQRRERERFAALFRATERVAGPGADPRPALVLWPESTWPSRVVGDPPGFEYEFRPPIAAPTRICSGTTWRSPDGQRAVAVLVDATGELLDLHEKRVSVPAGERVPFVDWLPDGVANWLYDLMTPVVGFRPQQRDGRRRPPLRTADDVPFAALTCYDNAFAWVAGEAVEDGARLLAVLSNESWYRQGAELDQMVAMSVFRALETATPVARSTVDGATCVVSAAGDVVALPREGGTREPRVLVRDVDLGPGALPPWFALHRGFALLSVASGLWVLLEAFRTRRRRRAADPGTSPPDPDRALDPA